MDKCSIEEGCVNSKLIIQFVFVFFLSSSIDPVLTVPLRYQQKLKVTASRNVKGEVSAGLEGPTYTWKDFGLTFKFIGKTENKGTFSCMY